MRNVEIEQRIKYLVEHGGLWDDPLADIRQQLRLQRMLTGVLALALVIDLIVTLSR
jgi:hypothetical protein